VGAKVDDLVDHSPGLPHRQCGCADIIQAELGWHGLSEACPYLCRSIHHGQASLSTPPQNQVSDALVVIPAQAHRRQLKDLTIVYG
jgi:hypothetical protein